MKMYNVKRFASDPFDVMCSDCPVHEIEYFEQVSEEQLREDHLYMLGVDASIPDWERGMMEADGTWEPTEPDFDKWLEQCITEGYIQAIA